MPLATVDIQVLGVAEEETATFTFGVNVTVRDPVSGQSRPARYKEAYSELSRVRAWLPDLELQQLDTPEGGLVRFTVQETISQSTDYKLNAEHYESGDWQEKRVRCNPDGSWYQI